MIQKFLLIFLLLTSSTLAEVDDTPCSTSVLSADLEKLAISFQIPNCNSRANIRAANRGDFHKLCQECRPEFNKAIQKNKSIDTKVSALDLNDVLLNELKRSLSANLLGVVNLKSIYSTKADFTQAISACNLDQFEKRLQGNECTKNVSLKGLKNQLAEELGHLLSKTPRFDDKGILNRSSSQSSCPISDVSILRARSLLLEDSLNDDIIKQLSMIKANDSESLRVALQAIQEKAGFPLTSSLNSHPVFSQLISPPENFIDFFKGLPTPISQEKLRASIYTNKKANDHLSESIIKRCEKAFQVFESTACDKDFKSGKVKLSNLKEVGLFMATPQVSSSEYVDLSSENDLKSNLELLQICDIRADKEDALDFTDKIHEISSWMPKEDTSSSFENYRTEKYENDIGKLRNVLCEIESGKTPCDPKAYNCQLYRMIKKESDTQTPQSRLARSSDKAVNDLLRSFIGSPDNISAQTRTTLVNEGILPKNDRGEFVTQVEVPERRPDFLGKMEEIANTSSSTSSSPAKTVSRGNGSSVSFPPTPQASSELSSMAAPSRPASPFADEALRELEDEYPDMSSINDEILRRLSQDGRGTRKLPTKEEARKVTRDYFKEKGRPLTTAQENAMADRLVSSYAPAMAADKFEDGERSTLTPGDTAKEKWEKEQKLKALSGMAGAKTASAERGPASQEEASLKDSSEGKQLSTVALTITEDKVKSDLSDLLKEKIIKNDSEGQLLKVFIQNKKDFILQLNNTSFQVKYDHGTRAFRVVFDSGDSKEALLLKPQLEKFFNSMKAK